MTPCACHCGLSADLHIGLHTARVPVRFTCVQELIAELYALGAGDRETVSARVAWLADNGCERMARMVIERVPFDFEDERA